MVSKVLLPMAGLSGNQKGYLVPIRYKRTSSDLDSGIPRRWRTGENAAMKRWYWRHLVGIGLNPALLLHSQKEGAYFNNLPIKFLSTSEHEIYLSVLKRADLLGETWVRSFLAWVPKDQYARVVSMLFRLLPASQDKGRNGGYQEEYKTSELKQFLAFLEGGNYALALSYLQCGSGRGRQAFMRVYNSKNRAPISQGSGADWALVKKIESEIQSWFKGHMKYGPLGQHPAKDTWYEAKIHKLQQLMFIASVLNKQFTGSVAVGSKLRLVTPDRLGRKSITFPESWFEERYWRPVKDRQEGAMTGIYFMPYVDRHMLYSIGGMDLGSKLEMQLNRKFVILYGVKPGYAWFDSPLIPLPDFADPYGGQRDFLRRSEKISRKAWDHGFYTPLHCGKLKVHVGPVLPFEGGYGTYLDADGNYVSVKKRQILRPTGKFIRWRTGREVFWTRVYVGPRLFLLGVHYSHGKSFTVMPECLWKPHYHYPVNRKPDHSFYHSDEYCRLVQAGMADDNMWEWTQWIRRATIPGTVDLRDPENNGVGQVDRYFGSEIRIYLHADRALGHNAGIVSMANGDGYPIVGFQVSPPGWTEVPMAYTPCPLVLEDMAMRQGYVLSEKEYCAMMLQYHKGILARVHVGTKLSLSLVEPSLASVTSRVGAAGAAAEYSPGDFTKGNFLLPQVYTIPVPTKLRIEMESQWFLWFKYYGLGPNADVHGSVLRIGKESNFAPVVSIIDRTTGQVWDGRICVPMVIRGEKQTCFVVSQEVYAWFGDDIPEILYYEFACLLDSRPEVPGPHHRHYPVAALPGRPKMVDRVLYKAVYDYKGAGVLGFSRSGVAAEFAAMYGSNPGRTLFTYSRISLPPHHRSFVKIVEFDSTKSTSGFNVITRDKAPKEGGGGSSMP